MKTTEHEDSMSRDRGDKSGCGDESGYVDANATVHNDGAKNCCVRSISLP
jgi:hypothetical protein